MSDERLSLNLQLTWIDPRSGETIEQIFDLPLTIGRDSNNVLMLPSTSVSRQHARVELMNEKILVKDLGSSNGTYINGELVEQGTLADGDELVLGEVSLKVALTTQARSKRPSRDHLFGALLAGEAEPTITLKSIKGKSGLFADIPADSDSKVESPKPPEEKEGERLSGEALKEFLSGRLQKDVASDISPDVQIMANDIRSKPAETFDADEEKTLPTRADITEKMEAENMAVKVEEKTLPNRPNDAPTIHSAPPLKVPSSQEEDSPMNKVWATLRRWFGA